MRRIVTVVLISSALAVTTPAVAADRASGISRADRTAQKKIDRLQREVRRATVRSRRARRQLAVTNARLKARATERDHDPGTRPGERPPSRP